MKDSEQISPALKSKRNFLYGKTERRYLFALIFIIPMCMASFIELASYNNLFMCIVILFACFYGFFPVFTGILIKKYWKCPRCNDILPNTWKNTIPMAFSIIACFPVYVEICPKCGHSLVEGKPPLTEAEIAEDKRKQRRKLAWIYGIFGIVMFIYFLVILVLCKKGII